MKSIKIISAVAAILITMTLSAEQTHHETGNKGKHFARLDKNKDGSVSKDEWLAKFKSIDANNDGKISKEEMKKHHQKMMKTHH